MRVQSRWRRVLRYSLLGLLGVVLTLALAIAWITQTGQGRKFLLGQVSELLSGSVFVGDITARRIDGPIFGEMILRDVTLTDDEGKDAAYIQQVRVRYTVRQLLRGRLVITRLSAQGAAVQGRIRQDGSLNLASLLVPGDPNKPPSDEGFAVSIQHLALNGTEFKIVDERTDELVVAFRDPTIEANFDLARNGDIRAGISQLSSSIEFGIAFGREFVAAIDELGVVMNAKEITFAADRLTIGQTGLFGFDGTIQRSDDPDKLFEYLYSRIPQLYFSPEEVEAFVPGVPLATPLVIDATLSGPPSDVMLSAALSGADQAAALSVFLDLSQEDVGIRGDFVVEEFQPERWIALPGVTGDVTAQIRFNVVGLTPARLKARLDVDIEPSTLLGYRLDRGHLALSYAEQVATIETLSFAAGGVVLSGDARVAMDGDLEAKIVLDAPDLSDLRDRAPSAPEIRGRLYSAITVTGNIPFNELTPEMTASIPAILEYIIPRLAIDGRLSGRGVHMPGVSLGNAEITLSSRRGRAADIRVNGILERLSLSGTVVDTAALNAHVGHETLRLSGSAKAMGAEIEVDADGTWSLSGADLTFQQLSLANGSLNAGLMTPARVQVVLDEKTGALQEATVSHLQLGGHGLEAQVNRFRYRGDGTLSGDVSVRTSDAAAIASVLGLEQYGLRGGIAVDGQIEGRASSPRYQFSLATQRFRALGLGPIDGSLRIEQHATHLSVDGSLCMDASPGVSVPASMRNESCGDQANLLLAQDLHLPFLPGFGPAGLRLDPVGELHGFLGVGPLSITEIAKDLASLQEFELEGVVGFILSLDGTVPEPNVGGVLIVDRVFARLDDGTREGVRIGPVSTRATVKIEDAGDGMTLIRYGLGERGLTLDDETWLRARGDLRTPLRSWMLGETTTRALVAETWGTLISMELLERELREIPGRFLPREIGRDGKVYVSLDVTRERAFTGAKLFVNGTNLTYEGLGPINAFVSVVSSGDTSMTAFVEATDPESDDRAMELYLDGLLNVGLSDLLTRGILPTDRLEARLQLPSTKLDAIPYQMLRAQQAVVDFLGAEIESPRVEGYIDVSDTLADLKLRGRLRMSELRTATGATTEAGIELLYGPARWMGIGSGDEPRFQASVSVCGPGNLCAMRLSAAALPGVRSGDFLFGDEKTRERASARLAQTRYAATLDATDAPLGALAPAWLLTNLATGIEGSLNANLRVDGTFSTIPSLDGTLLISDMRVEIIPLARRIEELDLTLEADGERILVHDLYINDGRGTLLGSGEVDLQRGMPEKASLVLDLHSFLLADASGMGAYVTGQIPVDATISDTLIDVDVRIGEAEIYVPDSVMSGATAGPEGLPTEIIMAPEELSLEDFVAQSEFMARLPEVVHAQQSFGVPIRVKIKNTGDIHVTQRFADVYLDLDMGLRLDADGIHTSGSVSVLNGYAQVFGKRFDVTTGRVSFDGGGEGAFDPRIRLTAAHRLPRKTAALLDAPSGQYASVSVVLDTRLSSLSVDLRSDPPMSESDILNVLLTGKPIDSGEARPEALTTAGSLLAGYLTDQLGANPVLDTVSVELDDSDGTLDSRLEGGRYFGKDNSIYATVAYIVGAAPDENSFEVSWQFILAQLRTSSVRLELRWGNRRTGAAEILYDLRLEKGAGFIRGLRRER